jgi:hypothetical protein
VWQLVSGRAPVAPDAWNRIGGATLAGGLREDGSFAGTVFLQVADAAAVAALLSVVPATVSLPHGGVDLRLELEAAEVDGGLALGIRVPDAVDALVSGMRGWRPGRRD